MNVLRRFVATSAYWRTGRGFLLALLAGLLLVSGLTPGGSSAAAIGKSPAGGVLAWGDNRASQLGTGFNNSERPTPGTVTAATETSVIAVSAGRNYSLALRADGKILAWGSNFPNGQLGIGTTQERADPTIIPGIADATMIAAGYNHGLASNGTTVYAWGDNTFNQLGYTTSATCGGFPCSRSAQAVAGLSNVTSLGAGLSHSLAVLADGSVWTWGSNARGQLGVGQTPGSATPVKVKGVGANGYLTNITAVAAGEGHSLALKADGTVYAWGQNDQGQLGIGKADTALNATPYQVAGLSNIVAISAGYRHSLALRSDGVLFAWGFNSTGQLGNGTVGSNTPCACNPTPVAVPGLSGVVSIGAGFEHSLAVLGDGTVRTWGANTYEQLGVSQPATIATPTAVPGLQKVFAVAGGSAHSLALALPTFCDVTAATPYNQAIAQLAGRGVIRGYLDGCFGPNDSTQRAQMAALIARAMSWDAEDHGNPFVDDGGINPSLWRNVGTLAYYGVAYGYGNGIYGPTDKVTQAQTISFITRAMVKKGYWVQQPDNPALYPNVPAASGHRGDLTTYLYYVPGALPETTGTTDQWANWAQPATRGWFAQVLWSALNTAR